MATIQVGDTASVSSQNLEQFRDESKRKEKPNLKDIDNYVVPKWASKWRQLGTQLHIAEYLMDNIEHDHPSDCESCCSMMFSMWLDSNPAASWEDIIAAVDNLFTNGVHSIGIHSTATSKAATSVKCSPYNVRRLKARYIKQLSTDHTDWPFPYVRLALVKGEKVTRVDKDLLAITKLTLQGQVDELLFKKEPLGHLRDIFHKPCPRLTLITGGPGIGKTTLAHYICVTWARDGFLDEYFDIIILITLRLVQKRSFEEVIMEWIGKENYQQMKKLAGSKCLIILEGLDEMAYDRRKTDPFLLRLIKDCTVFEEAMIIITSRPHACEGIEVGRRVEVVGFGRNEIREFVENSFPKEPQCVEEFIQQLDEYPNLYSLCYVPMNLLMVVDIFKHKKELPSTLTELYQLFIVMTLKKQVQKKNIAMKSNAAVTTAAAVSTEETILCKKLTDIPKETIGIVLSLSRLAYRGFFDWHCSKTCIHAYLKNIELKDPKIIFTESDLKQCDIEVTSDFDGLGLLKVTHAQQLLKDINTYSFNHLSIQEFLCAIYISLQSERKQIQLMRKNLHIYPHIFIFVCGLTGLASTEMLEFICYILSSSDFTEGYNGEVTLATSCIHESKRNSIPDQLFSSCQVDMLHQTLLPYNCLCVSTVLSCCSVSQLNIDGCRIGNKGAEMLVKHYPNKKTTGPLLEKLNFRLNDLTSQGMVHMIKILSTNSATLKVLYIGYNDIGDKGIAIVSEALQHNKSLTELDVIECGLSAKGAMYISQLTTTLRCLEISNNNIGDDGMAIISEVLQHNKSFIYLDVAGCGLSENGAVYISQLSTTLQHLIMSNNNINDKGMATISKVLQDNKSLSTLEVAECGLSVNGAISISKIMMVMKHSLERLIISKNNISDDGISTIAGALSNCKISQLEVNYCGITFTGARSLATALYYSDIAVLWMFGNSITVEGALLIAKNAAHNAVCEYVMIDEEYILNNEISELLGILHERRAEATKESPLQSYFMDKIVEKGYYPRNRNQKLAEELPRNHQVNKILWWIVIILIISVVLKALFERDDI